MHVVVLADVRRYGLLALALAQIRHEGSQTERDSRQENSEEVERMHDKGPRDVDR